MFVARMLSLYFSAVIGLSCAGTPYKNVEPKVFDPKPTDFEDDLYNAMEDKSKLLPDDGIGGAALETGMVIVGKMPVVGDVGQLILTYATLLEDGSDWKKTLARTIADGGDRKILENDIKKLRSRIDSIQKSLTISKNLDLNTVNWSTRKDLDYMMDIFSAHNSLFKKYPLVAAPAVIDLAHFIASLHKNINNLEISCTMRNILLDYRKRTVDARLDKISSEWGLSISKFDIFHGEHYDIGLIRSRVMSLDYRRKGYNSTNELYCEKYPKSKKRSPSTYALIDEFDEDYYYGVFESKYTRDKNYKNKYPQNEFNQFDVNYNSLNAEAKCAVDYFGLVRHRVEQLFPVRLFNAYCGKKDSHKPTGNLNFQKYFRLIIIKLFLTALFSLLRRSWVFDN